MECITVVITINLIGTDSIEKKRKISKIWRCM